MSDNIRNVTGGAIVEDLVSVFDQIDKIRDGQQPDETKPLPSTMNTVSYHSGNCRVARQSLVRAKHQYARGYLTDAEFKEIEGRCLDRLRTIPLERQTHSLPVVGTGVKYRSYSDYSTHFAVVTRVRGQVVDLEISVRGKPVQVENISYYICAVEQIPRGGCGPL